MSNRYQYRKEKGLFGPVTMEKPGCWEWPGDGTCEFCIKYKEHLAALPFFCKVDSELKWKDGEIYTEGVDFELAYQVLEPVPPIGELEFITRRIAEYDKYKNCQDGEVTRILATPLESEKSFGCSDIQQLLDYAPCCVEYENKTYCLNIYKSTNGYIAEYSIIEEVIHVDMQGIKFTKKQNLFDTYRRNRSLFKALTLLLELLHDNRNSLRFIPRIHPFNVII